MRILPATSLRTWRLAAAPLFLGWVRAASGCAFPPAAGSSAAHPVFGLDEGNSLARSDVTATRVP